jgi:hypothetical protein
MRPNMTEARKRKRKGRMPSMKEEFDFNLSLGLSGEMDEAYHMTAKGERPREVRRPEPKLYCLVLKYPNGEQSPCPYPFFSMQEAAAYLATFDFERAERESLSFELTAMLMGAKN